MEGPQKGQREIWADGWTDGKMCGRNDIRKDIKKYVQSKDTFRLKQSGLLVLVKTLSEFISLISSVVLKLCMYIFEQTLINS